MFLRAGYGERLDATKEDLKASAREVYQHLPFKHLMQMEQMHVSRGGKWVPVASVLVGEWVRVETWVPTTRTAHQRYVRR